MKVCRNFRVSTHTSTFALFYAHPNRTSFSNSQRWRNSKRCCMSLVDQFLASRIIKFRIHVVFPLTRKLQCVAAAHPTLDNITKYYPSFSTTLYHNPTKCPESFCYFYIIFYIFGQTENGSREPTIEIHSISGLLDPFTISTG